MWVPSDAWGGALDRWLTRDDDRDEGPAPEPVCAGCGARDGLRVARYYGSAGLVCDACLAAERDDEPPPLPEPTDADLIAMALDHGEPSIVWCDYCRRNLLHDAVGCEHAEWHYECPDHPAGCSAQYKRPGCSQCADPNRHELSDTLAQRVHVILRDGGAE